MEKLALSEFRARLVLEAMTNPTPATRPLPFRERSRKPGFTLVELLVVVAVIAIVLGLVVVGISRMLLSSRTTACLANQRQIVLANMSYAGDNGGRLASPRTDSRPPRPDMSATSNCWVDAAAPGAVVSGAETVRSLEAGALWSYLGRNEKAYASPLDPTGRVRSYSLSAFVGVGDRDARRRANDLYPFPDLGSPSAPDAYRNTQFRTVTLAQIPQPSRTLATIAEEDSAGYNFAGWIIEVAPPTATPGHWLDAPALWNPGHVEISYLDGTVESPAIISPELARLMQPDPSKPPLHGVVEPGARPGFRFMASVILPGIVRPELQ